MGAAMKWTLLTQEQYITTRWQGGVTTQLAIAPEGAAYAGRAFLWRLSCAQVELDHADFTPLPGYNRLMSVLKGSLEIKVGEGERYFLPPCQVCAFDGGTPVKSWGRCTDFNLMMRKGACDGTVQSLALDPGAALSVTAALTAGAEFPHTVLALYCAAGSAALPEAEAVLRAGQLLLCREPGSGQVRLESREGAGLMVVSLRCQ